MKQMNRYHFLNNILLKMLKEQTSSQNIEKIDENIILAAILRHHIVEK